MQILYTQKKKISNKQKQNEYGGTMHDCKNKN